MQVYLLEEATGQIVDYQSVNDFKRRRFLPSTTTTHLHGCFNQNDAFGTIDVKPFALSIKGLDCEYEFRHEYKNTQWQKLVGFMQYKCMKKPDNAKQLVDKICKNFMKSLKKAE